MGTKCPQCLSDNPDQSKFCAECGTKLSSLEGAQFTRTLTLNTALKGLTKGKAFAGKYMILDEIGRGGMGVVLEAEDTRLKRRVALKFLPPELSQYEEAKARFIREAQAAAALSHPNICTVHEVEESDGQPYIAMEYVQGRTLRQMAAKGPLDADTVTDLAVQVASGLEAAHQRGIVHRDIKSANIMVTDKGQAKIMDFGLAKVAGGLQITKAAGTMGTVAYMSPEQANGEDLDRRTDIWSFGVVLYEMLTGQLPFRGERDSIVLHSITGAEPKPLRQIKADIPAELQKIIDRALKKKREERYASAAEMAADLRAYLERRRAEEAGFFNLRSLARRMRKPAYFIPAAAVLVALGFLTYSLIQRNAHVRWAREIALPQVEKLFQANNFSAAYVLAHQAARYIPRDPGIAEYLDKLTATLKFTSDPPGAQVLVKDYSAPESAYMLIGVTPLEKVNMSIGAKRCKFVKEGFEAVEVAGSLIVVTDLVPEVSIKLDPKGSLPAGMIRIPKGADPVARLYGTTNFPLLTLEDYFIDKYEVTNRQYKKFLDEGGYRRPEFWKQKFVRGGKEIPWQEAMKSFVDKSGSPGPATWELGDYPEGQDEYPVSGVSWYEAAAYAEYAGKSLPTLHHWSYAAGNFFDSGFIVPASNFGGKGPVPVGRTQAMSPSGAFDMFGNGKEWCGNEIADGKRVNAGGGWDEPSYMCGVLDRYDPWFRFPGFGFRCMKYLTRSAAEIEAAKPAALAKSHAPGSLKPCSDEMLKAYLQPFEYGKGPLNPKVESRQDLTKYTVVEKVSFDAAYPGPRMVAYLLIPKEGKPPYQTVIHWVGDQLGVTNYYNQYGHKDGFDYLTRSGRALVLPVLLGYADRELGAEGWAKLTLLEKIAMRTKDYMRSIDYLETRPDFDTKKIAFEGCSGGAFKGSTVPAIEKRIKAIVMIAGGVHWDDPPYWNPVNLTPRITVPLLMQNGRYDYLVSTELDSKPLLALFGTPDKDKSLKLYESGHAIWERMEQKRDELDFLDKYLGPAK